MPGEFEQPIRAWLAEFVVGLNLCPFARPLLHADALRLVICKETAPAALSRSFLEELDLLQNSSEQAVATTLMAFPLALHNFEDYLDFLERAQDLLLDAGLEGVVQLASFHPDYCFAGEPPDAASNYSNRSPYPIIHLLREATLSRVLDDFSDPAGIPGRNIETLNTLGTEELRSRWQGLFRK